MPRTSVHESAYDCRSGIPTLQEELVRAEPRRRLRPLLEKPLVPSHAKDGVVEDEKNELATKLQDLREALVKPLPVVRQHYFRTNKIERRHSCDADVFAQLSAVQVLFASGLVRVSL